jgi:hypothetical protein
MAILAAVASSHASSVTLDDISPHFSTNMPIIWQAPTNHLPKSFWVYKKLPRVFSAATISNAIILASFQVKGFPKPSTNRIILWAESTEGEPQPPSFAILPDEGQLDYSLGDRAPDSTEKVANDEAAVERAWDCLLQLGADRAQFVKTNVASQGDWGIFFPRQIDGVQFYRDQSEGFSFQQFGQHGKIRCFGLLWPNLERMENCQPASPQQIIACIRGHRVVVLPEGVEGRHYLARVKRLAVAKKLIITKITPYYGEEVFGEVPADNIPPKIVTPIAELEAVADFGNSNMLVRIVSPITSSGVSNLLGKSSARPASQHLTE